MLRTRRGNELLLLNLLVILLVIVIIFLPASLVRVILGIPFVLFFPGYALIAALFPRREGITGVERLAFSFGLSLALVSLVGLILNYTPWGIRLESFLYLLAFLILTLSFVAWFRQRRWPQAESSTVKFQLRLGSWGRSTWDKVLIITLGLAVVGASGMAGYAILTPKVGQKFTEFYVLGLRTTGQTYTTQLVVGRGARAVVGIANEEYQTIAYRVEVRINGVKSGEAGPVVLRPNERWEGEISFVPQEVGKDQEIQFLLYKNGTSEPALSPLRVHVNVVAKE